MPYVEGENLRDRLRAKSSSRWRMPPVAREVAMRWRMPTRGTIHRDIKPENILFESRARGGRGFRNRACDWAAGAERVTQKGCRWNAGVYESGAGGGTEDLDGRTDIYSLSRSMKCSPANCRWDPPSVRLHRKARR